MLLALISRRSRFRAGTRYFRRGIDHSGHVANFNESEQILLIEAQTSPGSVGVNDDGYVTKLSFVQIRGSVPVFWSEINTLRYKPDLQIMDLQDTVCFNNRSSLGHQRQNKLTQSPSGKRRPNTFRELEEDIWATNFGQPCQSKRLRKTGERGIRAPDY